MENFRNLFHCFVWPHIADNLAESNDPKVRRVAIDSIKIRAATGERRAMWAIPSPTDRKVASYMTWSLRNFLSRASSFAGRMSRRCNYDY